MTCNNCCDSKCGDMVDVDLRYAFRLAQLLEMVLTDYNGKYHDVATHILAAYRTEISACFEQTESVFMGEIK